MAGGALRDVKNQAWEMGRTGDEDAFNVWMDDKWGLPHGLKLQTIFYDARQNTQVMARYNAAELALNGINMQGVPKKNAGGFGTLRWQRLKTLIARTNIALPDNLDITGGPALLVPRPVGQTKGARTKEQHTYRNILDKVAELMEFVTDIYAVGIANVANAAHVTVLEMRALERVEFLKCIRGYSAGICHLQMYQNLSAKVELVMHGD